MKKIVFGITSLTLGGAERVLVDIVNYLKDEYDITIFTLYSSGEFESELDEKIKLVSVYNKTYNDFTDSEKKYMSLCMVSNTLRRRLYKKYIKNKYDVEIAFLEGPITWIFSHKSRARKIAWVHNDIIQVFGTDTKADLKKKLSEKTYKKYDEIIFVSKDNLEKFESVFTNNVKKQVIHNYLDSKKVIEKSNAFIPSEYNHKKNIFVVVSRLTDQKGISRLIDVHKNLITKYHHHIFIIGDGPDRKELITKVATLGLENTFHIIGKKENPYPYVKHANYFMLPSMYEGFPMTVVEAKILSKPILITDTAAREVVENYKNSIVVENSEKGISDGMVKLMSNTKKTTYKNKDNEHIIKEIIDVIEGNI